ncbi:hypothetical protein [Pontibaca salina]|uniref:Secreted protein n=1 Tax=Pontibaca salina TaxID=2795731 RepID=A0A934LZX8_9RHOB|nr:hypothetical protein [Pontibaca salina]MBI6629158.1 hypothetical protein [Pontibaca salina]
MMRFGLLLCAGLLAMSADAQSVPETINDYPTEARADYIFGCMAANGQGQDVLRKCACSIDRIASILPYAQYIEAETVLSMQQTGGERMSIFRTTRMAQDLVAELRRAQAEADIICF